MKLEFGDIETTEEHFVLPASFAQESLWFADQLVPGSSLYNVPMAVRLKGELNTTALQRSLSEIVRRHEVLRTTFRLVDGHPMQVIAPPGDVAMEITDLASLAPAQRALEEERLINQVAWIPFDLSRGPLVRIRLLRTAKDEHILITSTHHIATDAWSEALLMRELIVAYDAFRQDREPELPHLPIQYADFAYWQRENLSADLLRKQMGYWREQLAALPTMNLPVECRRPQTPVYRGATEPIEIPTQFSTLLKALAKQERTTLFSVLLTAFKVLLLRYTGQEDVVAGSPFANRPGIETENLIGYFVNTLVLRTKLDGNPTFREAIGRVHETLLGARRHQEVPFEMLVQELAPQRIPGRNPLVQVMFVLANARAEECRSSSLTIVPIRIADRTAKFDLTMFLSDSADGIGGSLTYNVDLFGGAMMRRMVAHFRTLVESAVLNPDTPLWQLPVITPAEREQLITEWNRTETELPHDASINQIFEYQVARAPDSIAIEQNTASWTYRQLNERANQIARILQDSGAGAKSLIGICLERSPAMIAGMLAILKTGSAYVPIDPAYPLARRLLMSQHVSFLLTTKQHVGEFAEGRARVICIDDWFVSRASTKNLLSQNNGDSPAYVIYTSGSTGAPKGVMVAHRGIIRLFRKSNFLKIRDSDVIAQTLNPCFDASVQEVWGALLHGARLRILDEEILLDPARFKRALRDYHITAWMTTTALFNVMAQEIPEAFAKLRYVVFGGETADRGSVAKILQQGPPEHLLNAYGPTEASVAATFLDIKHLPKNATSIPIGRPISNTTVYLLDPYGNLVPIGIPGEIYIGGAAVAIGYIAEPKITAERFVDDPFSSKTGARLYKTGDLAKRLPDGSLEFLGRTDSQIKIRGFRIEPGEIEATLLRHPAIAQAVVVAREDRPGEKRLVAYIVPAGVREIDPAQLRTELGLSLPDYMMPSAMIALSKFPLTRNGKVDFSSLPVPTLVRNELVSPRDALETQLVAIWERALGTRPIGITDDFFRLGGHSLLAVQIFSEIEKILEKKLPLATMFQAPTVERLAATMRNQGWKSSWSPLVAIQPGGSRPPFFAVHGGYGEVMFYRHLAQGLDSDQPFYGLQAEGLDGSPRKHSSVEAMAKYYIKEMRKIQPRGPYLLGGYCMGGVIAFEMAQQLCASGDQIMLLTLFDTLNPVRPPRRSTFMDKVRRALDILSSLPARESLRHFSGLTISRLKIRLALWNEQLQRILIRMKMAKGEPLPTDLAGLHTRIELARACNSYQPRIYPGKITLFFADHPESGFECSEDHGWADFAASGLEIHKVSAGHFNMLGPPNAYLLAQQLDRCIEAALRQEFLASETSGPCRRTAVVKAER